MRWSVLPATWQHKSRSAPDAPAIHHRPALSDDLHDAWADLHDATPPGWFVGRPTDIEGRGVWEQYGFDVTERARAGIRSREWTAQAMAELEVIRELVLCLREILAGRVPR